MENLIQKIQEQIDIINNPENSQAMVKARDTIYDYLSKNPKTKHLVVFKDSVKTLDTKIYDKHNGLGVPRIETSIQNIVAIVQELIS